MKPFSRAPVRIASNHFSVADTVAVAICGFVGIDFFLFVVALHATCRVFVRYSADKCMDS